MDKPRIAFFLATSGHSGVDRIAKHLIPALARRGHSVDLLHVAGHGPHLDETADGVQVVELGTRHAYTAVPAVVRYLRRERPAILFSDKDRVNRSALLARVLAGVDTRNIFSLGTTVSVNLASRGWFERWLQRFSIGRLYRHASRLVVTAEGVADDIVEYTGLERSRIEVVPCPVIPERLFSERPPVPDHPWFVEGGPPVILGVGELSSRKDFATLIRAFAKLRQERACRLVILGRGKKREELLSLAAHLGVADDVDLPGFVPSPYAYMAHADLFAFTSRWEGLGFVLIEALAVGTPVVSTDCPSGPAEVLQNGRFGPLVPVGDAERLAEAMGRTLDDPLPPQRLREAAHPYEIEASADAYLDAFGLV